MKTFWFKPFRFQIGKITLAMQHSARLIAGT